MLDDFVVKILIAIAGAVSAPIIKYLIVPLYVDKFKETTKLKPLYLGALNWSDQDKNIIKLEIKKTGYDIKGDLTFKEGRHSGKRYEIKGKYSHGLLTFTYDPVDKGSTSFGTGFFQRREDGELFRGRFSYISQSSGEIESIECDFRSPSENLPQLQAISSDTNTPLLTSK